MDEGSISVREIWQRSVQGPLDLVDPHASFRAPLTVDGTAGGREDAGIDILRGGEGRTGAGLQASTRFVLADRIGEGGMGRVYRAHQESLGREVALKVAAPGLGNLQRRLFVTEARVTARLGHPNVVPVHDLLPVGEDGPALAMKLVSGSAWSELLRRGVTDQPGAGGTPSSSRDLAYHLDILLGVCNALAFSHSCSLVHCDVKPSNVMVGAYGEVYLMDWGLAVDVSSPPSPDAVAPHRSTLRGPRGTPCYMAPELASGRIAEVCPATDVYLLGAVLYEIVAGRPPHSQDSFQRIIDAAARGELPTFEPDFPLELKVICTKAMAARPRDRYESVEAFRDVVREFLAHREGGRLARMATILLGECEKGCRADGTPDRDVLYARFSEVVAGFRQALVLWPENPEARVGERKALRLFAETALGQGDLGLAESQARRLGEDEVARHDLLRRIQDSRREHERRARTEGMQRRLLLAAAMIIGLGLVLGVVLLKGEQRRTQEQAMLAQQRLANVQRLADMRLLADLDAREETLWPAVPGLVARMQQWLADARRLLERREGHRAYMVELRSTRGRRVKDAWQFDDPREQWEYETLADLVSGLEKLGAEDMPHMQERLQFASTVRQRSIDDHRQAWDEAVKAIADEKRFPLYRGLKIEPQVGLVPLGPDAHSHLWEFAHLASGAVPRRGADGRIEVTEEMGVVLVLLPGGTFRMGAIRPGNGLQPGMPNVDPRARPIEGPVREVTLAPFFMSKYEMTQAQWMRLVGKNPSCYEPGRVVGGVKVDATHPVENMNWEQAQLVLSRLALDLPTEAQWEYGIRGGTTTVYFTGNDPQSLSGYANLADRYAMTHEGPESWLFETWLYDNATIHSRVGAYRPNAFGLHDMVGNVWEWVQDRLAPYTEPVRTGDGARTAEGSAPPIFRGGGYRASSIHARSAERYTLYAKGFSGFDIGFRPARRLEAGSQ